MVVGLLGPVAVRAQGSGGAGYRAVDLGVLQQDRPIWAYGQ